MSKRLTQFRAASVAVQNVSTVKKEVFMNNRSFRITNHALRRMEARHISMEQLDLILNYGQVYSQGDGLHRAKLHQKIGKSVICYEAVFSKSDNVVCTVWSTIRPCLRVHDSDNEKIYMKLKCYKQRKRLLSKQEFDDHCREEYSRYNLRFSA